ncbi:hypothetical protein SLS56_011645 [Neofusicoccum ribis]|uniref:Uncharacterized protein n=1 Tax=Neofusicoccum ribis TaxID=45134 RepID=A0ABR3SBP8_9PEZI
MDASFSAERIPQSIAEYIRQNMNIGSLEDVMILTVSTSAPGCVICPQEAATLTPVAAYQSNVRCFQDICRATEIRFYLPAPNLSPSRQLVLDEFIWMTTANQLASSDINLNNLPDPDTDSDSASDLLTYALPGLKQQQQRGSVSSDFNKTIVALRGMIAIELATLLPDMIRNLLPGMLPEMLRIHLSGTLHGQDSQSEDSHQDEQDNGPSPPLITQYVQPLVLAHLPGLVQEYMDEHVDMNDVVDTAERSLAEVGDSAITDINEAKDECLKEIAAAQTDACERLQAVYGDCEEIRGLTPEEQEESPGRGVERMAALGRGLREESGSRGSSFRFKWSRKQRPQKNGAEPVPVERTRQGGHHGQQQPGKAMTTGNDDTTDEDKDTSEEETTDARYNATARHEDYCLTTLGNNEPGRQDEENRPHELIRNGNINAPGKTGHDTAAAPPFSRLPMHPEMSSQGEGDMGDKRNARYGFGI